MAPSASVLLKSASTAYSTTEAPAGYTLLKSETISNKFGLHVAVYKQNTGNDYIVSFRGTENASLSAASKDWVNNFNEGWPQYKEGFAKITKLIDKFINPGESSQVHLVGHSLGGALAQFAAYDFAERHTGTLNHRITLTTWNGLGGEWGLRSNRDFNASQMNGIQAIHYYRTDDIVAKLGGAHVGGKTVALLPPSLKFAGIGKAHSIEALQESLDQDFTEERKPNYFHFSPFSRDLVGKFLSSVLNAYDKEIEGNGFSELADVAMDPLKTLKFQSAIAEAISFLFTIAAERIANDPSIIPQLAGKALLEMIEASANNPMALATISSAIVNTAIHSLSGNQNTNRQTIGQLLIQYGTLIKQLNSDTAKHILLLVEILTQSDNSDLSLIPQEILLIHPTMEPYGPGMLPMLERMREGMRRAEQARPTTCPLIVDLKGDGIETLTLEAGVYFDHDANGFAERTGWVAPEDGLLVWDRNGDGNINSGGELFGNHTHGINDIRAAHGFDALAALDANKDGLIDSRDMVWHTLGVWQDRNSNATLDAGEWLTMEEAGVRQLNLHYRASETIDPQGNQHRQLGSYLNTAGEEQALTDVWFRVDAARSMDLNMVELDPSIQILPNIAAIGNVASLHQAMQRDASGALRRMVEQWHRSSATQQNDLINSLIFHWTGVQDLPSGNQPWLSDARILASLEAFLGISFREGAGVDNEPMASQIEALFSEIRHYVASLLNGRGIRDPFLTQLDAHWNPEQQQIDWQVGGSLNYLLEASGNRSDHHYLKWLKASLLELESEGLRILTAIRSELIAQGGAAINILAPLLTDHSFIGETTDSLLRGGYKDDFIQGQQGNDILQGSDGNDILEGRQGNDQLHGQWGNDIYLLARGFGQDTIYEEAESNAENIIYFTEHAESEITNIEYLNSDLILRFANADTLTVNDYYGRSQLNGTGPYSTTYISRFQFQTGTAWSHEDIISRVAIGGASEEADNLGGYFNIAHRIDGLGGDDTLSGANLNDSLDGNRGNDYLKGERGNDILRGGLGDDLLCGGGDQDTYIFAKGDGHDIIFSQLITSENNHGLLKFDIGVNAADIFIAKRHEYYGNLTLGLLNSDDQITIHSFFWNNDYNNSLNPVHQISFADGTVWDRKFLAARSMQGTLNNDRLLGSIADDIIEGHAGDDHLYGFEGDDTLRGGQGNDFLRGGPGNDILYGGSGDNQFRFSLGDGQDTIMADHAFDSPYRSRGIAFSSDINPLQVEYRRFGNQLHISFKGNQDSLTIQEFFRDNNPLNAWNPVPAIYFMADGSLVRADQIPARLSNMIQGTSAANTLTGTAGDEYISGLDGNDILDGRDGNDYLDGGAGIDTASYTVSRGAVLVDLSITTAQNTGLSGWDTLNSIENLTGGDWNDTLLGNAAANVIDGGNGDDWIDGGNGNDSLRGGANGIAGDTIAYASASSAVSVNLGLTSSQATGGSGSDTLSGFENLSGSRFNDVLIGSTSANRIEGGEGHDQIWGSAGRDHHSGGGGADQFLYRTAAEAGNSATGRDVISGFETVDRIDLSRIDAHSTLSGNQAFVWIGSASFKAPGQLRYTVADGNGLLEGNISGTSGAEFQIEVVGGFALQPGQHVVL